MWAGEAASKGVWGETRVAGAPTPHRAGGRPVEEVATLGDQPTFVVAGPQLRHMGLVAPRSSAPGRAPTTPRRVRHKQNLTNPPDDP